MFFHLNFSLSANFDIILGLRRDFGTMEECPMGYYGGNLNLTQNLQYIIAPKYCILKLQKTDISDENLSAKTP